MSIGKNAQHERLRGTRIASLWNLSYAEHTYKNKNADRMKEDSSTMGKRAFGEHTDSGLIVAYQSHQDALRFLASSLGQANGIALLQGPKGSGKTTIINEQLVWSAKEASVAVFDGVHLTPRQLLSGMLMQFDVAFTTQHDDQLLQILNNFLTQQTLSGHPPILMIDNAERATPSALRLLNWLAALDARGNYALRIVLTGKERLAALLRNDSMRSLTRRHPATYSLNPLTPQEVMVYLRTRLIAAGGERSEKIFPLEMCEKLHELSSGWPGLLNRNAMEVMERMTELRSARRIPRITISRDGENVSEYELTERQYIIGRTELADIVIDDTYVSKIHAMLQTYSNAIVLLDLNSTNGTTVNSRVVQKTILRSNDIITLGRYRIKIENAPAIDTEMDERIKAADTMTMQNLVDFRRSRAKRTLKVLKRK
jgi:type II secretory pathway predicted ATPase ExeA